MTIDFHTHVFPDKIAIQTVAALEKSGNTSSFSDGTYDSLIRKMKIAGVDISINLPVLTKPTQFDSILRFAVSINEKFNSQSKDEPGILSFAGMHPDIDEPEEKLNLLKESGIKGIKIHPDYQSTFFDDERYIRIFREAKRLGLITVTHAGFDCAYPGQPIRCTPDRVCRVLDKLGGYDKLVLAHMGANQLFSEMYETLAGKEVYFDTANVLPLFSESEFKRVVAKHGSDRILFATDSPWRDIAEDKRILKGYDLGEESENRILYKNAIKLLEL